MVVTWYRVSQYEDENDPTLFNTYQLLLIKRSTGSDADGWDFDFEFNYATLNDDEDGYQIDPETGLLDANSNECNAYDIVVDDNGTPDDNSDDVETGRVKNTALYANCRWGIGVGNYTVDDGGTVGYEFFEQYNIGQLIDSGDTAMIDNSLGSTVLGRYRCSMINGEARGCDFSAELADTGVDVNGFGLAGAALLAAGGIAVAVRRRKA
jgi:LPXTG-motif cell wall-anchored protein